MCGTKETEIHELLECKCYDMGRRRRWLSTCDVLEEKERTLDVIKGCSTTMGGGVWKFG